MGQLIASVARGLAPHVEVDELELRLSIQMMAYALLRMALMSEGERAAVTGGGADDERVEDFLVRSTLRLMFPAHSSGMLSPLELREIELIRRRRGEPELRFAAGSLRRQHLRDLLREGGRVGVLRARLQMSSRLRAIARAESKPRPGSLWSARSTVPSTTGGMSSRISFRSTGRPSMRRARRSSGRSPGSEAPASTV